jgi:putative sterol carrier protein
MKMEFQEIVDSIRKRAEKNVPIGDSVKFVLDEYCIHVDGSGEKNVVTEVNKEAGCTITTSLKTMGKIVEGDLNPMMATMTGKIKISGNMGLAMKLGSLI